MSWPVAADYEESIQNPHINFADPELKEGQPELDDRFGSPVVSSGNFASVYLMNCVNRRIAVRCFLREVPDQQQRYAAISDDLFSCELPYTVQFEYVPKGIRVKGTWLPVLKMDWCDGLLLHEYIEANLKEPIKLRRLADKLLEMAVILKKSGIAHGDLQHGNIFVVDDEIKLIDYDGMFVPRLAGRRSNELGIEHYQHPQRGPNHFGRYLDHFSEWVIYTSLVSLSIDPSLWELASVSDKHLLFKKEDFQNPDKSTTFKRLCEHSDDTIKNLNTSFKNVCFYSVEKVPELDPLKPVSNPIKTTSQTSQPMKVVGPVAASSTSGDVVAKDTASGAPTKPAAGRRDRGGLAESGKLDAPSGQSGSNAGTVRDTGRRDRGGIPAGTARRDTGGGVRDDGFVREPEEVGFQNLSIPGDTGIQHQTTHRSSDTPVHNQNYDTSVANSGQTAASPIPTKLIAAAIAGIVVVVGGAIAGIQAFNHPHDWRTEQTHPVEGGRTTTVPNTTIATAGDGDKADEEKSDDAGLKAARKQKIDKDLKQADEMFRQSNLPAAELLYKNLDNEQGASNDQKAHALTALGMIKIRDGASFERETDALQYFNKAIGVDAGCAPAFFGRGKLFQTVGLYNQAKRDLEKAYGLNPVKPAYQKAFGDISKLLKNDPQDHPTTEIKKYAQSNPSSNPWAS